MLRMFIESSHNYLLAQHIVPKLKIKIWHFSCHKLAQTMSTMAKVEWRTFLITFILFLTENNLRI